jgi:hypothetical protein
VTSFQASAFTVRPPRVLWATRSRKNPFKAASCTSQLWKSSFSPFFLSVTFFNAMRPLKNITYTCTSISALKRSSFTPQVPTSILSQVQPTNVYLIPTMCGAECKSARKNKNSRSQMKHAEETGWVSGVCTRACDPSYSGGGDWEDQGSRQTKAKRS